jgi:excisionase family DNA binding protein
LHQDDSGYCGVLRELLRPLVTVRDVAAALRVSTATIYTLADRGELAHVRVSNTIRVTADALSRYLNRPSPAVPTQHKSKEEKS